ncbi:DUF6694 family lipoprotein [Lysobacter niastensis]|uniref:Lipoprotein n=1 Tax=Lysobacter niastensis TaxID=380629 RepID=A0ABS0B4A1_9GAMM|nr:DUF6694 family lipoprotein [Lysobacter niastensis]MBF6023410.1 hypothetical protein [Lysobacter niastensis]
MKNLVISVLLMLLTACASSPSRQAATRLDATSNESAEASFRKMSEELPGDDWQKLSMAMIAINLKGVQSAGEIVRNPELQRPSISRIKDEVAGMTAQEIIDYAAKVASGRMELRSQ